jgi:hypothetical protein
MKAEKEEQTTEIQKEPTQIQTLKVELTAIEWEAVLSVIEQSTSPHIQVKAVAAELVKQLQPQIKNDK